MKLFKSLAINIILIGLVLYLLSWLGAFLLNVYTRHGESLTLPNLKGLSFEEVDKILSEKKLRYFITDTAFIDDMPKGSVVEQNPSPNTKVKEGRFIYITIKIKKNGRIICNYRKLWWSSSSWL
jgi:beta-lactam-binding protein with PASTA domain